MEAMLFTIAMQLTRDTFPAWSNRYSPINVVKQSTGGGGGGGGVFFYLKQFITWVLV